MNEAAMAALEEESTSTDESVDLSPRTIKKYHLEQSLAKITASVTDKVPLFDLYIYIGLIFFNEQFFVLCLSSLAIRHTQLAKFVRSRKLKTTGYLERGSVERTIYTQVTSVHPCKSVVINRNS